MYGRYLDWITAVLGNTFFAVNIYAVIAKNYKKTIFGKLAGELNDVV